MHRIRLFTWHTSAAEDRAEDLRELGYEVDALPFTGNESIRAMRDDPPSACVIDLTRAPSQGRDVGVALRHNAGTRSIPLVFIEGDPDRTEQVRSLLPDAAFTSWTRIERILKRTIENPPPDPIVPSSNLAGYADTPLPQKLGLREGMTVILLNAPDAFEAALGELPADVMLRRETDGTGDLYIWFVRARHELEQKLPAVIGNLNGAPVWIAWPKKGAAVTSDLTQQAVRETGLAAGLVDFKICAIDETWSGLKFTRRKK